MHTLALQLAPVVAAEKSKVPFYVAGAVLVIWALTLSMALGMRKPAFPGDLTGQRIVSAITAVLVLAAVATAVLTSGTPASSSAATATAPAGAGTQQAPAPAAPAGTAPANTSATPTTTTGSPAQATATPASSRLALAADPGGLLKYDKQSLSAKAGSIAIAFTNLAPLEHNVTIAQGSTVLGSTPSFSGGSRTLTIALKPGTYSFYCSVPGHRQAGMEGKLVVS